MESVVLTTPGAGSWTPPAGVTSVYVECWGGGGAGQYGGGAGGGAWSAATVPVAGAMNYYIAAPQAYDFNTGAQTVGQDTWFGSTATVRAKGAAGHIGGQASAGVGTEKFSGGSARFVDPDTGQPAATGDTANRAGASASKFGDGGDGLYNVRTGTGTPGSSPGGGGPGVSNVEGGGGAVEGGSGIGGSPGGGSRTATSTRGQIRLSWDSAQPIVRTIASTSDDGYYTSAGASSTGTLVNGIYGGEASRAYLRFLNITAPKGANVASAILRLKVREVYGTAWGSLRGVATDNALAVGGTSLSNLTSTSQSTTITSAAVGAFRDLDVTAIVQAIVNRTGWTSGNALAFLGDVTGANDEIYFDDFSQTTTGRATLTITLGEAVPGDTTAPTITSSASPSVAENTPNPTGSLTANETVTWTKAGGADAALFSVSGSTWTLNTTPDFEAKSSYVVIWRATDAAGNWSEQTMTLAITDVAEGGTVRAWTPDDLSGKLMWLDMDDAATLAFSSYPNISTWSDKSGAGRHAISANPPAHTPAAINGRPAAYFFNDRMSFPTVPSGTTLAAFFAIKPEATQVLATLMGNDTSLLLPIGASNSATNTEVWRGATTPTIRRNGAIVAWANRGQANSTLNDTQAQVLGLTDMALGANLTWLGAGPFSYFYRGLIGEVVFIGGALSADDTARLEGYLAHKWGTVATLPAGHPYKAAAPTVGSAPPAPARRPQRSFFWL